MEEVMAKIIVLFHANCTDGAGAMWSAWKHFGDRAEYIAVGKLSKDNDKMLKKCAKAEKVFMCDMMLYYHQIQDLLGAGVEIHLLDHHVTNMNTVLGSRMLVLPAALTDGKFVPFVYDWQTGDLAFGHDIDYTQNIPSKDIRNVSVAVLQHDYPGQLHDFCDMSRSGAGITWDHFHSGSRPSIIDYIEDFDLWNWALPDGDSIHTYLSQFNWRTNDEIIKRFSEFEKMTPGHLAAKGKPLSDYKNELIRKNMAQVGRALVLGKYNVPILNTNHFISETGNIMAKDEPFAVLWQLTSTGTVRISLRSDKNGLELPEIVAILGIKGGGHIHAAGTIFNSFDDMLKQIEIL